MVASFQDVFESLCTAVNRWLGAVTTRTIPEPIPTTATTPPQDTSGSESMRISQAGIDLIKSFEGLKLEAYRDPVGVVTIGWGHTKTARMGQRISRERAEELLPAAITLLGGIAAWVGTIRRKAPIDPTLVARVGGRDVRLPSRLHDQPLPPRSSPERSDPRGLFGE